MKNNLTPAQEKIGIILEENGLQWEHDFTHVLIDKLLQAQNNKLVKRVEEADWERCQCGAGRRLKNSILSAIKQPKG